MLRKSLWTGLALLLIGVSALWLLKRFRAERVAVRVVSPRFQDLASTVSTGGKVVPVDDFQVRAAFSAPVEKIYVKVGDKVAPGQLLIQLKDPFASSRYASAQAAVLGAEAGDQNIHNNGTREDRLNMASDLTHAELEQKDAAANLATLKRLQATGAASQGEVDAGEHRLQLAVAALDTLRKRMSDRYSAIDVKSSGAHVADTKAALGSAQAGLANANIRSTIAGTVYSMPVAPYDFVNMGAELMRVADLRRMQVKAYVDEPDIGLLIVGQPVAITWSARPGKQWAGVIKQVPLTVFAMGPRMVGECLIEVDNADGALLPNIDVVATVTTRKRTHILTIPRAALHVEGDRRFVYRVVDGTLVRTPVTTGLMDAGDAEITQGLGPGDILATRAVENHDLADKLPVTPVP